MLTKYGFAPLSKRGNSPAMQQLSWFTKCTWMIKLKPALSDIMFYHTYNHSQFARAPFAYVIPFTLKCLQEKLTIEATFLVEELRLIAFKSLTHICTTAVMEKWAPF